MIMTTTEMVARVRNNVDEPIPNIASDAEITSWLSSGLDVLLQTLRVQAGDISQGAICPLSILPDVAEYTLYSSSPLDIVVAIRDGDGNTISMVADPSLLGAFIWRDIVTFNPVPQEAATYKIYYLGGASSSTRKTVAECIVEYACAEYFRKDRNLSMVGLCIDNYHKLERGLVSEVFAAQPVPHVADIQADTWDSYYLNY